MVKCLATYKGDTSNTQMGIDEGAGGFLISDSQVYCFDDTWMTSLKYDNEHNRCAFELRSMSGSSETTYYCRDRDNNMTGNLNWKDAVTSLIPPYYGQLYCECKGYNAATNKGSLDILVEEG